MGSTDTVILQRNGCPVPMERLSSLERMLGSIQRREENSAKDEPPALPHRPVSKARTPPGRRRAVVLPCQGIESNGGGEMKSRAVVKSRRTNRDAGASITESFHDCDPGDICFSVPTNKIGTTMKKTDERSIEKEVIEIQKCFRGHKARCYYHDLKRVIISLQSFVRGENDRKNYQVLVEKRKEERVQVPYSDVAELQRRVLRAEAELGNKSEENAVLQLRLEQFDRRWKQYEAKMKFMEKMWQDQLASIQARLVAENEKRACENSGAPHVNGRVYTIKHYIEQHERGMEDDDPNSDHGLGSDQQQLDASTNPEKELKKLKFRFKSWNKDYKTRLRETKATISRPENSRGKKNGKWWWER